MAIFDPNAVVNALAWHPNVNTIYCGGQGAGDGVEGRQLHNSSNYGDSFIEDVRPPGAINALAVDPRGNLLVGSWYQVQQDSGNPEASFAQFRRAGSVAWEKSSLSGFADHLKNININERGVSWNNGTFYIVGVATYEIVPPTPDDPWSECLLGKSRDGVNWEWHVFPADLVPENMGVYEVAFVNDTHGIAIGGTHLYGGQYDYLAYILVTNDGGHTWTETFRDVGYYTFTDINCVATTCWVSGHGLGINAALHIGFVWRSTNLGHDWDEQLLITGSATSYAHLWHVHFVDSLFGYAQGDYWGGLLVLYVTEDGGRNWKIAWDPNCQDRHYVHDVYADATGALYMLVQEPDISQTGIIKADFPLKK
jgi:hypothetical protein